MKKKVSMIMLLSFFSTLNATIISQNGMAKDNVTGLMWQDESYTSSEEVAYNDGKNYNKVGNEGYAKGYCENLTLGGFSDFRLPNIYELTTLIDNTKSEEPYIVDGIKNIASQFYWTSTTSVSYLDYSWTTSFGFNGGYNAEGRNIGHYYIRCVRGKELSFHDLVLLKKSGKINVSQIEIDDLSTKMKKPFLKWLLQKVLSE